MHSHHYRIVGLVVWLLVIASVLGGPLQQILHLTTEACTIQPLLSAKTIYTINDPSQLAKPGLPVFARTDGIWKQCGVVTNDSDSNETSCTIHWYSSHLDAKKHKFVFHRNSGRLSEVISTLLPAQKRQQISNRLNETFERYGQEFINDVLPLVQQTLSQAAPEIEAGIRVAAERHQTEIDELLERWKQDYIDPEIIPLAKQELLPIVRLHAQPVAESIGRELWDRASLWRFGWRAAYDKVPLPKRNLVQQEWERFVEDDAVPVFEDHTEEVVAAIQRTLSDIASDQNIRRQLSNGVSKLANDEETRQLLQTLLREAILENDQLRVALEGIWKSERANELFAKNSARIEPVIRQIGEDLFGSEADGINPDFARVLRNQILGKDRMWLVAIPIESTTSQPSKQVLSIARDWMPYPLVYTTSSQLPEEKK